MDKQQAQRIIRETFEGSFDKTRFTEFIKNLLNRVDDAPFNYRGKYIPDAYKQSIKTLERIGKFSDGENNIDILVITLQKETSLERARTMQRNFIAWYLNGSRGGVMKEAALAAFVSPGKKDWRFSLVKMDYKFEKTKTGKMKVKEEFTPARRWSFLVGENEKSHTAQSRLWPILADDENNPTLKQLEDSFNIETVTKEFFREYRELFLHTKEELDRVVKKDPKIKTDFEINGVDTVNFAKKLLGQIIFLYFLQKKGWFGVGRDDDWGTGSKQFLRELFEKIHGDYSNFFNNILEPLFYEALRIDRSHDDGYYSRFDCKIPFLNGGLFDPIGNYDWVHTDILIPDKLFSNNIRTKEGDIGTGILDVFDRYNFTVKEDEPLEKEVAIDPELLGKSYEKFNAIRPDNYDEFKKALKSGKKGEENKFNKKFGVYYTPREIVHYMCQQSLINYLDTSVNTHKESITTEPAVQKKMFGPQSPVQQTLTTDSYKPIIPKKDIEKLIHIGEQVSENEARILRKGKETKAYSHQLPESIRKNVKLIDDKLVEITVCDPAVGSGAFPVGMMSEIVRVRNVLSVFLNGNSRTAYEFKRRCIEHSLYGVDIDPGAVEIAKLRLWLSLVVDEDDIKNIKPLPNLDYKIVRGNSLIGFPENWTSPISKEIEDLKNEYFSETNPSKKTKLKKQIDEKLNNRYDNSQQIFGYKIDFDFRMVFSEVFHNKGGFDVVIANPPYVSVEKFARTAQQAVLKRCFKTYTSRGDIYCFFYERGLGLLRDVGVLTFISSNKFQRAGYGKGLRQLLVNQRIETLMDFCELPVFAAATDPMIVIVTKTPPPPAHDFPVVVIKDESEFSSLLQSLATRGTRYNTEQLKVDGWSLEGSDGLALVEKLRSKGMPLGEYVNGRFYYGIKTGLNEAFVIDCATRDRLIRKDKKSAELIKPWIRGKDIKRWKDEWSNLYLIQIESSENKDHPWSGQKLTQALATFRKHYPAIATHLLSFKKPLRARTDQGVYLWELRSCDYWIAFDEPKIVIADIGKVLKATWSESGHVIGNTGYIIPNAEKFLLAVLLGTVVDWFARMTFQSLGDPWTGGRMRFINRNLIKIPVPVANTADKSRLIKLAERAAKLAKADNADGLQEIEREIDQLMYQLYDLTPEEIKIVEGENENVD